MAPEANVTVQFGVFLTPTAADPERVVDLAVAAEGAGIDLVTVQDHPYQPAFLDAWTLLSFIAGRTERVQISGNVLNLPLRHPAMLARSAASLDLLTGGRVTMGLGAGFFWDGVAAMGGPHRTPGEGVDALSEAITVIRALWSREPGGVHLDGPHYPISGAKRGPHPAHDIPIWLGALKPRMLRLIGRQADGWWASIGMLADETELASSGTIIDEAARAAGRDPAAIRRVLNIGRADAEAERLVHLAGAYGVSTFVLAGDDPRGIERFGAQVAPIVRAELERQQLRRATGTGV
jgi:alkanesulfonate monooxygenase SsuD/methylene tetrahydromethanopterin reductase-like flavin-dependent oxidoreductase (luciferase family)